MIIILFLIVGTIIRIWIYTSCSLLIPMLVISICYRKLRRPCQYAPSPVPYNYLQRTSFSFQPAQAWRCMVQFGWILRTFWVRSISFATFNFTGYIITRLAYSIYLSSCSCVLGFDMHFLSIAVHCVNFATDYFKLVVIQSLCPLNSWSIWRLIYDVTSNHQWDIVFDNDGISILALLSCIGSITLELGLYQKKTLEFDSLHGAKVVARILYVPRKP